MNHETFPDQNFPQNVTWPKFSTEFCTEPQFSAGRKAEMSGVQPCRTEIGVFQFNIGDAQWLFTSHKCFRMWGQLALGALVLVMMPCRPAFKMRMHSASTGFWLGWPASAKVSLIIIRWFHSVISSHICSGAWSLCKQVGHPSCWQKSWWALVTCFFSFKGMGKEFIILEKNPKKICESWMPPQPLVFMKMVSMDTSSFKRLLLSQGNWAWWWSFRGKCVVGFAHWLVASKVC